MKTYARMLVCVGICLPAVVMTGAGIASGATYTWDGTANTWNSAHWLPGPVAGPMGASNANSAIINSGTVTFAQHDSFGNHATTASPIIAINGGTLASGGSFTTMWNLNMGGGALLANGGANATYPAFQLAGTLTVSGSAASAINVGGGANNMINVGGSGNTTLTINVADVTGDSNADLTINTVLQNSPFGGGGLTKSGAGTLSLTGANTFTGNVSVTGGTLKGASASILNAPRTVTTAAGTTLQITDQWQPPSGTTVLTGNGTLQFDAGLGNAIGSGRNVTVSMSGGWLNLAGGQLYNGGWQNLTWTNNYASLNLAGGTTLNLADGKAVSVDALTGSGSVVKSTGAADVLLTIGVNNGGGTFSGGITNAAGTISLLKSGAGTQVLSGASSYTGTTTIRQGTLVIGNATALGAATSTVNLVDASTPAGAAVSLLTNAPITLSRNISVYGYSSGVASIKTIGGSTADDSTFSGTVRMDMDTVLTAAAGGTVTFSNAISSPSYSSGITKAGAGTVILSGANTYTGTTTISGGTLVLQGSSYTYNGGSLFINGASTLRVTGTRYDFNGETFTFDSTGGGTIDAVASGAGGFVFTGSNTFTTSGGEQNTMSGSGSGNEGFNLNGNTATFNVAPGTSGTSDLKVTGKLWNSGSIVKTGSGTLELANANTYTGTTTIRQGTLVIGNAAALGAATSTVNLVDASTPAGAAVSLLTNAPITLSRNISVNGWSSGAASIKTLGGITADNSTFSGTVRMDMNTVLTAAAGGTVTFSNAISSPSYSSGIIKDGAGTVILSGVNTYTGGTTVNAGTLLVNTTPVSPTDSGTGSGAVLVAGGTLGGRGTVGGNTAILGGAFLSPGASTGTLTFAGNLDISGATGGADGSLFFDLDAGLTADKVIVRSPGLLSIGTLDWNDFVFTDLGVDTAGVYTLFDTARPISGSLGTSLAGTVGVYNGVLSFAENNQDIVLTLTEAAVGDVPEPATMALLGLAAAGLGSYVRRRRTA